MSENSSFILWTEPINKELDVRSFKRFQRLSAFRNKRLAQRSGNPLWIDQNIMPRTHASIMKLCEPNRADPSAVL